MSRRRASQSGIATVWALAWVGVCTTLAWVGAALAVGAAHQHHADASADLVSLSAASALQRGGDACRAASTTAAANKVALTRCRVVGADVLVAVREDVRLPFGVQVAMTGAARAGPS
jgi:secretion/DNA translocation related TadE-like protein